MKRFGNESGQTLIMVAVGMSVMLGFVGFATDVGVMLHEKRIVQAAADSAAIAGAARLPYGSTAVTQAALADATLNGFTHTSSNGINVTVTNPPLASQVGNASFATEQYVQVTISQNTSAYFMKLFNLSHLNVSATAVASDGAPDGDCVYVLNQTASQAMELQGSFDVSTPGCGVIVDSNSPSALDLGGKAGTLTAGSVGVVGGAAGQISDSNPAPVTSASNVNDPLAATPAPEYNDTTVPCSSTAPPSGTSSNLAPITPPASGIICYKSSGNITLSNVTLGPGVYVFDNPGSNLVLSGSITNTGSGVTLYLLGGLDATTNSALNLNCPQNVATTAATFPYQGILIYAAQTDPSQLNFSIGNATGQLTGIIYAPDSQLFLQDSGSGSTGLKLTTDLIVNTLFDKTASLTIKSFALSAGAGNSPLTHPTLVE
jgi:Flp pilus assembly protein TadG